MAVTGSVEAGRSTILASSVDALIPFKKRSRFNWLVCTGDSAIPAALLKIAMEGEDGNSAQIAESTFQDRSINRRRTSGRTAKRRNWPRVQNRRSLDVKDVVQYVK